MDKIDTNQTFDIYHDFVIHSSKRKVFEAVSDSDLLINWWPLKCSGTPNLGEQYNFYFTPEYDWFGEVIKSVPGESFHIKMTQADPDWENTSIGFDLVGIGENTQLRFWHKGWPACNEHFRRSSFCWAMLLNGLKNYLEKGIILPFEERS